MTDEQTYRSLYGHANGAWLLITAALDTIGPPTLDVAVPTYGLVRLEDLGDPCDVIRRIHERHGGHKHPVQEALCAYLDIRTQQALSRYATGAVQPHLTPDGWSRLVRAWFEPRLVDIAIAEVYATRENATTDDPV